MKSEFEQARQQLLEFLRKKSIFHGDFLLSSGERSKYYIDCRLTTLDPLGATLVGKVMYSLIQEEIKRRNVRVQAVGGLTMGADPMALSVAMESLKHQPESPLQCFVVRKTAKAHGQTKLIEGNFKPGDTVVALDDVVTKGDSTLQAIDSILKENGKVAFAAVLVDRQQGGRAKIEERGIPVISAFTRDLLLGT